MDTLPAAIKVKNLSKKFPTKTGSAWALKDVSFEIELGQVACLLGPNGSGKTTLLKILAGLLSPTDGELAIMEINPKENPPKARRHIGWMPAEERSGFYGRLTGRENLYFFSSLQGIKGKHLERVLGNLSLLLGLNEELDKKMLTLSGGNKQKLGLTRTLIHDPSVLLLDEPFRNLDPHTVVRFRHLLKDHLTRVQKKTVLLSTHQLEEAVRIADSILIISEGRIIKSLSARELKQILKTKSAEEFYLQTVDQNQ